MLISVLSFIH
uniref:Uncharacterized protein n=1 Tax=Anguilla anguilla TaxID=7936 RepID=A0A0E9TK29_ANGAN